VAILLAFVVVPEIKKWQARRALDQAMKEFEASSAAALDHSNRNQPAKSRRTRDATDAREQASRPRAGERCIGGSVVLVRIKDGVPSYQQVLEQGRPVRCEGNSRQ